MFDWNDDSSKNDSTGKLIVEPEYVPPSRHGLTVNYVKLFLVLALVALILVCGLIAASVTSCGPAPTATQQSPQSVPAPDGSIYHPYRIDASPSREADTWNVETFSGRQEWYIDWIYGSRTGPFALKAGRYILYQGQEYQIASIDVQHLTMTTRILGN